MTYVSKNKRFLDPSEILPYAGIQKDATVADFGCGNGFYPVAAGKLVGENGIVYAVDVKNESLEATMSAARHSGLKNVYTIRHDMEQPGTPIKDQTCDAVILSGILHLARLQKNVLRESYRVLKSGGKVIIIEWKKESLPFGPKLETRISEGELKELMASTGFTFKSDIPADYFHYALTFIK